MSFTGPRPAPSLVPDEAEALEAPSSTEGAAAGAGAEPTPEMDIVLGSMPSAVADYDVLRDECWWGGNLRQAFGYRQRMVRECLAWWRERIHPEDRERAFGTARELMSGDRDSYTHEYRFRRADATWARVLAQARSLRGADGRVSRILITMLDLTAWYATKQALRDSEKRYRRLVETSPDGIIVYSRGVVSYANTAMAELLGLAGPEALRGRRIEDIVHPSSRDEVARRTAEAGGETWRGVMVTFLRHDGRQLTAELSSTPIPFAGHPARLVVVRDVTQRQQAAQEVELSRKQLQRLASHLLSVREEEQARLARDVHDELGQALTGLNLELSWLARKVRGDGLDREQVGARVEAAADLVQRTLGGLYRLTRRLRPALLDDLGLEAAIEWVAEELCRPAGFECEIDLAVETTPPPELATGLFRIVQEALTNSVRHSRGSRITIALEEHGAGLRLRVEDDGRGLPSGDDRIGLGLLSMQERAAFLGGDLVVDSRPGGGTLVEAWVPLTGGGEK